MANEAWPGLTDENRDRLAGEYDKVNGQLAVAAYAEHPNNENAAARRMVELKLGLARADLTWLF